MNRQRRQARTRTAVRSRQQEPRRLLAELMQLAAQLEIEVVREPIEEGQGGLCRVYDRRYLFVDPTTPLLDQVELFVVALAALPTDHLYVRPRLRELLERARQRRPRPR